MFCCPEIYSDSAAGNVNCPLCNGTSTRSRSTGLLDAYVDDHVCPQCRHTLSDAVAIDEFAHHRKCSTEVSFLVCFLSACSNSCYESFTMMRT